MVQSRLSTYRLLIGKYHFRILFKRGQYYRSERYFARFIIRQALKLRYWVAAGVFSGSVAASNVS